MHMNTYEIQKGLIKRDDKVLILLRAAHLPFPKHWDLPGGGMRDGEDPNQTLEREIKEETQLETTVNRKLDRIELVYDDDSVESGKSIWAFNIWSTLGCEGSIQLSDEHIDFQWVAPDQLKKIETEPYLQEFLNKKH
jgi:8-oxo-dGTP diphosphatase